MGIHPYQYNYPIVDMLFDDGIRRVNVKVLIDSGAQISLVKLGLVQKLTPGNQETHSSLGGPFDVHTYKVPTIEFEGKPYHNIILLAPDDDLHYYDQRTGKKKPTPFDVVAGNDIIQQIGKITVDGRSLVV